MITTDEQVKLLDFGLAKVEGAELTKSGSTMVTVAYMSPEQVRGSAVDRRTGVWSLGVVLYEMISGRQPFDGLRDAPRFERIMDRVKEEWRKLTSS